MIYVPMKGTPTFMKPENWQSIGYFKPIEFACKCPNHKDTPVYDMCLELIENLVRVRKKWCEPIVITCGWRCETHNAEVGGVSNSFHTQKLAVDITIQNPTFERLVDLYLVCEMIGFMGIGFYPAEKFIHIDMGNRVQRWRKDDKGYVYLLTPYQLQSKRKSR